jgi:transposase
MLEKDEQLLRSLARECKDAKEKVRLLALHAISIGNKIPHTAEVFCVDEETVRRWIERWEQERDLSEKPREGRPQSLTDAERQKLKKLVEENNPRKHGINASAWDTKELQAYFMRQGKLVSRELLRTELLKMGGHYIKAQIAYSQADEQQRIEFARKLLKEAVSLSNNAVLLFEDEMSAGCSPRKGYGWTFEKRLVIRVPQTRKRLNLFAAVNPLKGKVVQLPTKEAKAPAFVRLLDKVLRAYPGKQIFMYADGLPVHKSKCVKKFLEKNPRLQIKLLPPYSPDLNPTEQLWRHYRAKLLNNKYFNTQHRLSCNIHWFTKQTSPQEIMQICSLTPIQNLIT